ncbi:hypothetical protein BGW80DRAFT_1456224 [Lactifluus volemus]|nr:hypothetical protein BGW80DRAFT_1456224 [Lactifluus volemus]
MSHVFLLVLALCVYFFKVCDMYRDAFILNVELFLVIKMMVGNNLKDIVKQMTLEDLRLF